MTKKNEKMTEMALALGRARRALHFAREIVQDALVDVDTALGIEFGLPDNGEEPYAFKAEWSDRMDELSEALDEEEDEATR